MKKRLIAFISTLVLSVASLSALPLAKVLAAAPYTCTWTGGGDGTSFNSASNWSGCNSSYPQAGDNDNLVFNESVLTGSYTDNIATLNDNISGLSVGSITFEGSNSNFNEFAITGDAMTITNGIVANADDGGELDNDVTFSGNQSITGSSYVNLGHFGGTTGAVTLNGTLSMSTTGGFGSGVGIASALSGTGTINITGASETLTLDANNSGWSGTINVTSGALVEIDNTGALGAGSSQTTIDDSSLSLCYLQGGTVPNNITIGGDDAIYTSCIGAGGGGYNADFDATLSGSITLSANTTLFGNGKLTVTGPLSGAHTLSLDPGTGNNAQLVIASSNNTSNTPNGSYDAPSSGGGSSTKKKAPKSPDTGMALVANHPAVGLIGSLMLAGGLYLTYRKFKFAGKRR